MIHPASSIVPYPKEFPAALEDYCRQIREAKPRDFHHDQRRSLFMNFLREGFGVATSEVELEQKIKVAQVRGYIDALYQTTIFEFKTDFDRERPTALSELKRYFQSRPDPSDYLAVLTDGLRFEVLQWRGEVVAIDEFTLSDAEPLAAYLRIDQFLKTERPRTPTSFDLVLNFGPNSAAYRQASAQMLQLYEDAAKLPAVATKFREWNKLLSKVYGSELGKPDLFVTHTYLVILSRLMVAQALYPGEKRNAVAYRGALTGEYFSKKNLPNLAEPDFFSWAVGTGAEGDFLGLIGKLEKHLSKFDFSNTAEDILKELYQGLVDPSDRHDLGEYYTPDWLAELTLERLDYKGGTILDPSCGSGSFLMCAVRRLRQQGLKKRALVEAVAADFAGIDVHPLAVLMAKANLLLALGPDARGYAGQVRLPIFMADTLQTEVDEGKGCLTIPAGGKVAFHIPLASIGRSAETLDQMIEEMQAFAHAVAESGVDADAAKQGFLGKFPFLADAPNGEAFYWRQNLEAAAKLIRQKRNSIWAFILKNSFRPTYLRKRKVEFIVGNPPWLSFRYIKDADYKGRVKKLARELRVAEKKSSHLTTQLDLSTVFYRYCEREFLAEGGKMGLVLPRSVIIGAKQHAAFQEQGGFSSIIDCEAVEGLFNVPSCALLRRGAAPAQGPIPTLTLVGKVDPRNAPWSVAKKQLEARETSHEFVSHEIRSPWYREIALQGATLVPRAFWFVEQDATASHNDAAPYLKSSARSVAEAKDVWKRHNVALSGQIERGYLYYTVLASGLLAFSTGSVEPVFLPIEKDKAGDIRLLSADALLAQGHRCASSWLLAAEKIWQTFRKGTNRTLLEWIDYNNKLSNQGLNHKHIVIFNTSGTNLTAAVLDGTDKRKLGKLIMNGFVADAKTYYLYLDSLAHADYLCAALNSEPVMEGIKATMPRGLMGERDIHRRPFEACRIPLFDPGNKSHAELARLGAECRIKAAKVAEKMEGAIGRARLEMRAYLADELAQVNKLAAKLIGAGGAAKPKKPKRGGPELFLF